MGMGQQVLDALKARVTEHGLSIDVYATPTYTKNDEGYAIITKGIATSVKALIFLENGDVVPQLEGIERFRVFRVFIAGDAVTIAKETILSISSIYYKVIFIDTHPLDIDPTYYELVAEEIPAQNTKIV